MSSFRTLVGLAACALPAALILAAPAARAQSLTLNSGDAVTVSSAGTIGTIGGQPVANNTTSYSDNGSGYAVETYGTAAFTLGTGGTLTAGQDGTGLVENGSSGSITVTGGTITAGQGGTGLEIANNGDASVGGAVTVSGGTISAGDYGEGLRVAGGSLTVSGGTITAGQDGAGLSNEGGAVTVSGGTFTTGQDGIGLTDFYGDGAIDLFGSGFSYTVNGVTTPITSGALPSSPYDGVGGTLTGTLLNNTGVTTTTFYNYGTIEVNVGTPPAATPEPSQSAALTLGALGLSALALRARRRWPS